MSPDVDLARARQSVAARTAASFATVPHFYVRTEIDAANLVSLRAQLLPVIEKESSTRLTLTDLLLVAIGRALADYPRANCVWRDDRPARLAAPNVALVVGLEEGLQLPVLHNPAHIRLGVLARQRADLVAAANAGRVPAAAVAEAACALSNLGNSPVDELAAVIPPGQSSVLAVGRLADRPFVVAGNLAVRPTLRLCLSADHRVLDGRHAGAFLGRIAELLSQQALLIYR